MSSDTSKMFLTVPIHIKVNWYEEKLDKFYETDKDNNGYIHVIYYYKDIENDPFPESLEWFKTEEERDKVFEEVSDEH